MSINKLFNIILLISLTLTILVSFSSCFYNEEKNQDIIIVSGSAIAPNVDGCGYIVMHNNYVYYNKYFANKDIGIYRYDTVNKKTDKISDRYTSDLFIYNNRLYYINKDEGSIIQSSDLNGADVHTLSYNVCSKLIFINNQIFYINSSDNNSLYKINLDGTMNTIVNSNITDIKDICTTSEKNICLNAFNYDDDKRGLYLVTEDSYDFVYNGYIADIASFGEYIYFIENMQLKSLNYKNNDIINICDNVRNVFNVLNDIIILHEDFNKLYILMYTDDNRTFTKNLYEGKSIIQGVYGLWGKIIISE